MKPRPIRVEGDIAFIPLTKGYEALIDAADVELVRGANWGVTIKGGRVYAYRARPVSFSPGPRSIYLHHVIFGGPVRGVLVDHKNCNTLDCRRDNLRPASSAGNVRNSRRRWDNTSGFKGVSWNKQRTKWEAYIHVARKKIRLGLFALIEEAAAAYAEACRKYHGEFGRTA